MSMQSTKLPVWFWVVAVAALLWNLMGVASYLGFTTMSAEAIAKLPEDKQALLTNYPVWATAAGSPASVATPR